MKVLLNEGLDAQNSEKARECLTQMITNSPPQLVKASTPTDHV